MFNKIRKMVTIHSKGFLSHKWKNFERFRHDIISDAVQGFKNMQQGGPLVDRPRNFDEEGRRIRKQEKKTLVPERTSR